MSGGLLALSAWVRPLGFVKQGRETESELDAGHGEFDLLTVAVLLALDVLTLPLALLWLAGVERD